MKTKKKNGRQDIVYYPTNIKSLDDLLENTPPRTRPSNKTTPEMRGIAYYEDIGFFGAIFGSAGSGKSILGMELCCRFVWPDDPSSTPEKWAIYVSQEEPGLILAKMMQFGFVEKKSNDHIFINGMPVSAERSRAPASSHWGFDQRGLHIVRMPLQIKRQKEVLENIFNVTIGSQANNTLVCVDNAETIADSALLEATGTTKDPAEIAKGYGTAHRDDHNFFKLVRAHCARHRINSFFIYEEKAGESSNPEQRDLATTAQAYAADIVIRLSMHQFPAGYKERTLEIIKAKNQYYRRGRHHFSIVGSSNPDETGGKGIIIYPSLALQLHQCRAQMTHQKRSEEKLSKHGCSLGIPDLDEKLRVELGKPKNHPGFLRPGTVSVLVSDLDIRADDIALHFAFQDSDLKTRQRLQKPLYLSLVHQEETLEAALRRFKAFASGPKLEKITPDNRGGNFYYFPPEHSSEGKLLRDISTMIGEGKQALGRRVVIDNLFGLKARWPLLEDAQHFIATLFTLFRQRQVVALVVDMVEVGEGRNPIGESFAAGLADHVFTLRHVELHSEAHTAFSAVKMPGYRTPHLLWDLVEEPEYDESGNALSVLRAHDTFAFYKNVLSGKPEPVRITMSLYADAEDSPLSDFLKDKQLALSKPSGRLVDLNYYERHQYIHYQNCLSLASAHPLSDCHIVSVDETWIARLLELDLLEEIGKYLQADEFKDWQFKDRTAYVTAGQDLAFIYRAQKDKKDLTQHVFERWYLVPDRNNCGVLCLDEEQWTKALKKNPDMMEEVFGPIPKDLHGWLGQRKFLWKEIQQLQKKWKGVTDANTPVFTFCMDQLESCVCFLLELALSRCQREQFVDKDRRIDLTRPEWKGALSDMVRLLDKQELTAFSSGKFRLTKQEPRCLFSRQWFSTWGSIRKIAEDRPARSLPKIHLAELPLGDGKDHPTPVSGAWYLGILKGSVAIRAGVQVIKQFTSEEDNLFKLNAGIGLPVRKSWYKHANLPDVLCPIPYRSRFLKMAMAQKKPWNTDGQGHGKTKQTPGEKTLKTLHGDCPFYRMQIKSYEAVAPIIYGMMVDVARRYCNSPDSHSLPYIIDASTENSQRRYEEALRRYREKGAASI